MKRYDEIYKGFQLTNLLVPKDITDLEKLRALLTEFGVGFNETAFTYDVYDVGNVRVTEYGTLINCIAGNTKIDGYPDFKTLFEFDNRGKFIQMGAWE